MSLINKDNRATLQLFWTTISGWEEIKRFWNMYFFILRKPFYNTVQVFKKINPKASFSFFIQSTITFTIITSIFMAFQGNDILKSIVLMVNQLFFLTLSTLLYYIIFNFISKTKKSFTDFLSLYTLYMGFILPFFAIGLFLQWQIILMITNATTNSSGPNPIKLLLIFSGTISVIGFSIYYSSKMIKYFWNIRFGWIALGMAIVFLILSPLQQKWIQWQCKLGITPEFEFNSLEHRKATYAYLGCDDISCKKCLLIGEWEITDAGIEKLRKRIFYQEYLNKKGIISFIDESAIDKEVNILKRERYVFDEKQFTLKSIDTSGFYRNTPYTWFISDDGKNLYFLDNSFQLLGLKKDTIILENKSIMPNNSTYIDTISLQLVKKNDMAISYKKLLEYLLK